MKDKLIKDIERLFFESEIWRGEEHNFCECDQCDGEVKDLATSIAEYVLEIKGE